MNTPQKNTLPSIPNLQAHDATWLAPWNFAEKPRISFTNKDEYKAYIRQEHTQSCLFSGISGLNPQQRVCRENPPTRLHAVVADYDTPIDEKKRAQFLEKLTVKPSFVSRSYSGGTHAIWLLEEPLPLLPDAAAQNALLKTIAKDLKLNRAFGTLDEIAFYNTSQVYHVGWEWLIGGGEPIPATRSILWTAESLKKAKLNPEGIIIPFERVAEEVEKRFPNRWQGEFSVGARGCRFWDDHADNHSAAIVTEHGMVCFTGVHSFRSWKQIFGDEFVKNYEQDTLGAALNDCYFINNKFFVKEGDSFPSWTGLNRQNMESYLAATFGLRTRCAKDGEEDESEVRRTIGSIITQKRLYGVVPLVYNTDEVVEICGEKMLNTNKVRVYPPADRAITAWGDGFPWIAHFLENIFPDALQRERFICEWAYAYKNAHAGKPKNGRTVFIAGEKGRGKNFITEVLIGPSLGGFVDASPYVIGDTKFNESFFRSGVWVMNDSVNKDNFKDKQKFSQTLKKMSANMSHTIEGKFKEPVSIPWSGRLYITLNTDPASLSLLPEMDINNNDKVSLYLVSGPPLDDSEAAEKAKKELPMLCSYLLNMKYPEHCVGDARWGVKGYLHEELFESAKNSGRAASFEETLNMYVESVFEADKTLEEISCPATEWFVRLAGDEQTNILIRHTNAQSIGTLLGMLAKRGDYPIEMKKFKKKNLWRIDRAAWFDYVGHAAGILEDENMPF